MPLPARTRALRLAAAALVAAAAGATLPAAPAAAQTCAGGAGVSVVVDFHGLGGGRQSECVDGGARTAADALEAAGIDLAYVQRQPGFVCRVAGQPADDPCINTPPADAYWGLWWSDGTSGQWTYATLGVDSQQVPAGGAVALSWNDSSTRAEPGIAPPRHAGAEATAEATTEPTTEPATEPGAADSTDDALLPTWVGPVVVGGLFAAGAAVAVVRRRRGVPR